MSKKLKTFFIDLIQSILIALIISIILLNFVLMSVSVDGTSMYPTLNDEDKGISFIITRKLGIKRFDIAVIDVGEGKLLVKRVIGLPGEEVEYKDNMLYINGVYYEEPFVADNAYTENLTITLKDDEYFCLGDNRVVSKDSRYYGPFKDDVIVSTHVFVLFPFKDFGVY